MDALYIAARTLRDFVAAVMKRPLKISRLIVRQCLWAGSRQASPMGDRPLIGISYLEAVRVYEGRRRLPENIGIS